MNVFQSIVLGLIQGCTEFLPVSSSGHLVLAKALMNVDTGGDISFEVFFHFGTLLSVLLVFKDDVLRILLELVGVGRHPRGLRGRYSRSETLRLAVFIAAGSVPAGIVGYLFDEQVEQLFSDPKLVAVLLLVTGLILFLTRFARVSGDGKVSLKSAIGVGAAQAFAVLPGISRAGTTISAGLIMGISQEQAARFSFLLAVPVIFGATLLKSVHLVGASAAGLQIGPLVAGTIVAFASGYAALKVLLGFLRRGTFSVFSYYCFAAGIAGILFIG